MLNEEYKIFKSGTDIRGVGSEGVPGEEVNLTDEIVARMAAGFLLWAEDKVGKRCVEMTMAVGRDCRISGERIAKVVIDTFVSAGVKVYDCGMVSTPSMFMTTVDFGCDAAVQITASHHPFNRNGLKFFTARGGLESADIREILTLAKEPFPAAEAIGCRRRSRFMDTYAAFLRQKITDAAGRPRPLAGLRIVVDAGNGAGGFFTRKVLEPLGADTTGSRYLDPDGRFPNHAPNPESPEAMTSIREAVLESHADFGIVFDTDVDRAGAVLSSGEELNRNRLIAMISAILLREHPGTTIVTDSITSTGLAAFIRERGGVHRRFRRGYRNVINEAIRLNAAGTDCQLAMETSGHGALKENWFLDDGAYLITRLLMELACGRALESLIAGLPEDTPESFRASLDECLTMGADNITVHTLSLKKGSRITLEGSHIPGGDDVARMLDYANETLRKHGYAPYYLYRQKYMSGSFENVGWTLPGAESLYNIYIMEELHGILSLGAGGSTKMVGRGAGGDALIRRAFNAKYPTEYVERPEKWRSNLDEFAEFYRNLTERS